MSCRGNPGIQRAAVETDIVAGLRTVTEPRQPPIDRNPPGADPLLDGAARSEACTGQQFLKS